MQFSEIVERVRGVAVTHLRRRLARELPEETIGVLVEILGAQHVYYPGVQWKAVADFKYRGF